MPKLISQKNLKNIKISEDFIATQNQSTFLFSYDIGYLDVYVNGVKLINSEFSANNGSSVILTTPCNLGDNVQLTTFRSRK